MPAKEACGSGGPKGGTPYVRQDGTKSGPQSLSQHISIIVFPCVIACAHLPFVGEVQPVTALTIIRVMVTFGGKKAH